MLNLNASLVKLTEQEPSIHTALNYVIQEYSDTVSRVQEQTIELIYFQTKSSFWEVWHDFEVKHGNEDTFREMLRIKRSVQAQFNTQVRQHSCYMNMALGLSHKLIYVQVNFMSAQMMAGGQQGAATGSIQSSLWMYLNK